MLSVIGSLYHSFIVALDALLFVTPRSSWCQVTNVSWAVSSWSSWEGGWCQQKVLISSWIRMRSSTNHLRCCFSDTFWDMNAAIMSSLSEYCCSDPMNFYQYVVAGMSAMSRSALLHRPMVLTASCRRLSPNSIPLMTVCALYLYKRRYSRRWGCITIVCLLDPLTCTDLEYHLIMSCIGCMPFTLALSLIR